MHQELDFNKLLVLPNLVNREVVEKVNRAEKPDISMLVGDQEAIFQEVMDIRH